MFGDLPQWDTKMKNFPKETGRSLFEGFEYFETQNPCVSFKTGRGMRLHTLTSKEELQELPLWGTADHLRRQYENK